MLHVDSGFDEAGGNRFKFGVDASPDPHLAMALRTSMQEEQNKLERDRAQHGVKRNGDEIQTSTRKVARLSLLRRQQPDLFDLHSHAPSSTKTGRHTSAGIHSDGSRLICFKTLTEDRSVNEKQILLCAIAAKEALGRHKAPSLALLHHKNEQTRQRFGQRHQQAGIPKATRKARPAGISMEGTTEISNEEGQTEATSLTSVTPPPDAFQLDFSTLENADVLENFYWDRLLDTSADDEFNFDPNFGEEGQTQATPLTRQVSLHSETRPRFTKEDNKWINQRAATMAKNTSDESAREIVRSMRSYVKKRLRDKNIDSLVYHFRMKATREFYIRRNNK